MNLDEMKEEIKGKLKNRFETASGAEALIELATVSIEFAMLIYHSCKVDSKNSGKIAALMYVADQVDMMNTMELLSHMPRDLLDRIECMWATALKSKCKHQRTVMESVIARLKSQGIIKLVGVQ